MITAPTVILLIGINLAMSVEMSMETKAKQVLDRVSCNKLNPDQIVAVMKCVELLGEPVSIAFWPLRNQLGWCLDHFFSWDFRLLVLYHCSKLYVQCDWYKCVYSPKWTQSVSQWGQISSMLSGWYQDKARRKSDTDRADDVLETRWMQNSSDGWQSKTTINPIDLARHLPPINSQRIQCGMIWLAYFESDRLTNAELMSLVGWNLVWKCRINCILPWRYWNEIGMQKGLNYLTISGGFDWYLLHL